MKLNWIQTPWIFKKVFSNYVWDIPNHQNKIYLTFDDGPTPEITEWVLKQLNLYQAKATFFCIGDNIQKHPKIFEKLIVAGHAIGNHTYNHLNGWKTATNDYISNAKLYETEHYKWKREHCQLFRPPFGKIKPSQYKILRKQGYKIIMWDIISYDFEPNLDKEKYLKNILKNIRPGSIIVFHDSKKAYHNLVFMLPKLLEFVKEEGFVCEKIN